MKTTLLASAMAVAFGISGVAQANTTHQKVDDGSTATSTSTSTKTVTNTDSSTNTTNTE